MQNCRYGAVYALFQAQPHARVPLTLPALGLQVNESRLRSVASSNEHKNETPTATVQLMTNVAIRDAASFQLLFQLESCPAGNVSFR